MSRNTIVAIAFIAILALIGVTVWIVEYIAGPNTSTTQTSGTKSNPFTSLFPFGNGTKDTATTTNVGTTNETGPAPSIRKVSAEPVAGGEFAQGVAGPAIRYVERQTGHIYETPIDSLGATRLTNTTIPAIADATWVTASSTIFRFLAADETHQNFLASVSSYNADQSVSGTFLQKFNRFALSPNKTILTVTETSSGATIQTVLNDGTKPQTLATSPIRSWIPLAGGSQYFVASAPASGVPGSVYNITTGAFKKVLGDVSGLTASVSPSGNYLLASSGSGASVQLAVYDLKQGSSYVLSRATLSDKCAWVPHHEPLVLCAVPFIAMNATLPDDWLLGRAHSSDDLWLLNPVTGAATAAVTLNGAVVSEDSFDISNLIVSDDASHALFINKNDDTLWSVSFALPK